MFRNSEKQDSSCLYFQAHIGQLVAVQHKRGAQGGLVFTRGLNLHLNLGDTGADMPEESLGGVREAAVEQFLHLGTAITIHHHIADGPHSSLRVQATVVRAEEGSGDTIPQEYINTFSPFQTRAALAVSFTCIVSQNIKLSLLTLRVTMSPSPKCIICSYFSIFFI